MKMYIKYANNSIFELLFVVVVVVEASARMFPHFPVCGV